jgi:hypothetical protein
LLSISVRKTGFASGKYVRIDPILHEVLRGIEVRSGYSLCKVAEEIDLCFV